jgi:protein associated with RNAse G/E
MELMEVYDKKSGEKLLIKAYRFNGAIHSTTKPAKKKKAVKKVKQVDDEG